MFRNDLAKTCFEKKYRHEGCETWPKLAKVLAVNVCGDILTKSELDFLAKSIEEMKFIPGGRYLYYANRKSRFYNNCYLLKAESDTREDWGEIAKKVTLCLMTGGGIGVDYSVYRGSNHVLKSTGGVSSGAIPIMRFVNEIGREVQQGGSRRSAIFATINWQHEDIVEFLNCKNWDVPVYDGVTVSDIKRKNFNYNAPLDMTNISPSYDDEWLRLDNKHLNSTFLTNMQNAMKTGEPGFSFNFGEKSKETLRNACTEITSSDDSDCCNLGSLNMARIETIEEFIQLIEIATKMLICGTLVADLPYAKVKAVRQKNRRLGLGLMGLAEWLYKRGYSYDFNSELLSWLVAYKVVSDRVARDFCEKLSISEPVAKRAIAPTGTIGMMAGTTTGIEPPYCKAGKRRYLNGNNWNYQYYTDSCVNDLVKMGINIDKIETALDLSKDPERRIKMQFEIQKFVDQGISSTVNLMQWGSKYNNPDLVESFSKILSNYAHGIRGITFYPDGARGGQPIEEVDYCLAQKNEGKIFIEKYHDVCTIANKSTCEA